MNGASYVENLLRSPAILNFEKGAKCYFSWSILAGVHPCINCPSYRVSNYRQYFNEKNFQGFDFSNGFRCTDIHKFEKLINLSINIFETGFFQDQKKWKHKVIPIEISKNGSDRVSDLLSYKKGYVLVKKL